MRIFAPTDVNRDAPVVLVPIGSGDPTRPESIDPADATDSTEVVSCEPCWQPRQGHRYRGLRLIVKRSIDVAGAIGLVLLLSPVLVATSVAVRLTSPGPALFRQDRVGQSGRHFRIVKFRSMQIDAEERLAADDELRSRYLRDGYKLPLHDDPRITRLGVFLRKTSVDELPQLWNVLKGEMSLVGPRPVVPDELREYRSYVGAYLLAKPGMTGPWQVAGRDAVPFPHRARFDADYIDGWSLRRDAEILARTIPAAVSARGVH